jgi:hypothetical protein
MAERQLGLFAGKRQRGVTARPRAKEFELQCMVADVLRRWCDPAWIFTAMPMGEKREPVTAVRLHRMGVVAGYPDMVFFGPASRVCWLELKRPGGGGRLSDTQEERSRQLVDRGHEFLCTNDFEAAIDWLRDRGIVRARVSA